MNHIILIGFPGSGKSALGVVLSHKLNLPFVDTDLFISQKVGCSIPEIFKTEGENAFRLKEKEALVEILKKEPHVIATGGGMPCFFSNMELMKKAGITIYLKAEPEQLTEWLLKSSGNRPLTAHKNREELSVFVDNLLKQRAPYYEQASLFLPAHGASVDVLAVTLKEELDRLKLKGDILTD